MTSKYAFIPLFIYIQIDPKRLEDLLDIYRTSLNELNVYIKPLRLGITINTLLQIIMLCCH